MPAEEKGDFSFSSCLTATERSYWGGLMTAPFFLCRAPFENSRHGALRSTTRRMSQPDRIEFITELVTPLAASLGLTVWGIEIGGAARPIARIYVDVLPGAEPAPSEASDTDELLPQGVTIDQCAELSRLAGLALDVEDPFASNWTLEISSPGLQRPFFKIDQLKAYVGRELDVVLAAPLDTWPGRKKFSGVLTAVADEEFTLALPAATRKAEEPEEVTVAWPFVRKATLIHHFPEPGKKLGGKKDSKDSRGTRGGAA